MSTDFIGEDNAAGQTILRLVSRGNAIIAELLRLSEVIPPVFAAPPGSPIAKKYSSVIFDFKYLKLQEHYEEQIDKSKQLQSLNREISDSYGELIERFYGLFESIPKYISDFNTFIEDVNNGIFIQQTLESIMVNTDGKQLISEGLFLFGVMLLLLDEKIPGLIRERLVVAFYRDKGKHKDTMDSVLKLATRTEKGSRYPTKPATHPVEYFSRFPVPKVAVQMIIGRLRSDDIYNSLLAYPLPEHRSVALSNQASMLFVLLYFSPHTLAHETAVMREIVDKHFSDNWVITYYMGFLADLSTRWKPFKAAKAALANTLHAKNTVAIANRVITRVESAHQDVKQYLKEGVLNENYVLDHVPSLLNSLRSANSTIRWLLLHMKTEIKGFREQLLARVNQESLLKLLLSTAQFEFLLKAMFQTLLDEKPQRWEKSKTSSLNCVNELADYFSGSRPLTKDMKDEQLQAWFERLAQEINKLSVDASALSTGRNITQMIKALVKVQEFHQIQGSLHIKEFLAKTRDYLADMLRTVNVKESVNVTLSLVADFSYGWQRMGDFTALLQDQIKKDPMSVLKIRAVFLKLVSILDLPLLRIIQAKSPDGESVSAYYSGALVRYVRRVLDIIPKSMFNILRQIIDINTYQLKRPTNSRIEKGSLVDYAQLALRHKLSKLIHNISVFTEGILAMKKTLIGIIEIDPKALLEDGVRKQLVEQVATTLHQILHFKTHRFNDFEQRLVTLASTLAGYKLSLEYISDYVVIHGARVWQEEFSRIVLFAVEQECNPYTRWKVPASLSEYQNENIPIPVFPQVDDKGLNFIGRLSRELSFFCDPRNTIYSLSGGGWFDKASKTEAIGIKTFAMINDTVSVPGLVGMDRLFAFMILYELNGFSAWYKDIVVGNSENLKFIGSFSGALEPKTSIPANFSKLYGLGTKKLALCWPRFQERLVRLGKYQLIRRHVTGELRIDAEMESSLLSSVAASMNDRVLQDIISSIEDPSKPRLSDDSLLLTDLKEYVTACGLAEPVNEIFLLNGGSGLDQLTTSLFLFTLSQLGSFVYSAEFGSLICKQKGESLDGWPLVFGIATLLKQLHSKHTFQFIGYCGQWVRAAISSTFSVSPHPLMYPMEVINCLLLLEQLTQILGLPRSTLEEVIPPFILDSYKS